MATVVDFSFDTARPQTHQGIIASPAGSPRIPRPASQSSLHIAPSSNYSPATGHEQSPHPMSAYPTQAYRPYQPASMSVSNQAFLQGSYPGTASAVPFYPSTAPIYESRGSQPMIRTVSHAHPMNSATEATVSSRYSSSPHSAVEHLMDGPPTASGQQTNPYPAGLGLQTPSFSFQSSDDSKVVNPSIFQPSGNYSMSRSTSGASDFGPESTRLVTPAFEYRQDRLSPAEQELRKVSDSLGDHSALNGRKLWSGSSVFTPSFDLQPNQIHLAPHAQPENIFFGGSRGDPYGNDHFTMSAERGGEQKPDLYAMGFASSEADTEYERARQSRIMNNKQLLENVGLGNPSSYSFRARDSNDAGGGRRRKPSTPSRRLRLDGPVRASPRIREMGRNISYANLEDDRHAAGSDDEDEYGSDAGQDEEEDFRPSKRSKGSKTGYRVKSAAYSAPKMIQKQPLSLWALLQVYREIPYQFPLFYYTLNNDLTINSDSVPLIGSIPSTCTPMEKAETLRGFFHRGRRVLAQLDAFTSRCDRKYEGPAARWPELDYHTRIAVRDVRRKVVERCENYKYTRRDILDKCIGKNKWPPIDEGLLEWRAGMINNDPADDWINVTLTLPTPPPHEAYNQQMRYGNIAYPSSALSSAPMSGRSIKPFPSRSRVGSSVPRTMSINMGEPDDVYNNTTNTPHTGYPMTSNGLYINPPPLTSGHSHTSNMYASSAALPPPAPMYGEDEVPMSVQMPSSAPVPPESGGMGMTSIPSSTIETQPPTWAEVEQRGMKRSRSNEEYGTPQVESQLHNGNEEQYDDGAQSPESEE
ncbi:uncharacterized protein I303_107860 [Kwoniella dejecticola CBS 10117]|uniref:Uncharacterized protein n=1 Tax=Kwoniella dejecticola CBS 10117 TaxID=1296121 RepID=A0A1A5ZVW4_9TREE|nr:uncharacterized protein I303_07864 [Kwoniella dejecticola CBS 10117]OBR81951.1 hypothetical protein I303_07864 [Kwoniella dejecticola CBS 10117]